MMWLAGVVLSEAVFNSVSALLVTVRNPMSNEQDYVELESACYNVYTILTRVLREGQLSGLSSSALEMVEHLIRGVEEIEWNIINERNAAPRPLDKYKIADWKRDLDVMTLQALQVELIIENAEVLDFRNVLTSQEYADGRRQPAARSVVMDITGVASEQAENASPALSAPAESPSEPEDSFILPGAGTPACARLISGATSSPRELISLIEVIMSSKVELGVMYDLCGDDTQALIDAIHKAIGLPNFPPHLRAECLRALYRICGRRSLLPGPLHVPRCCNPSDRPLYRGGFADVWRSELQGSHVAVKELRVYSSANLSETTRRFCKEVVTWSALRHPNVLPLLGISMDKDYFAMVSEWMVNGNINEFVREHREANRFELLKDATNGLMYMHSQGMIHGDLKGANILVDENGRARLADFGLLTIASDPTLFTASNSTAGHGTIRWMSPELIDPEYFGLDDSPPTKESDCYALGMVVYEVLSGRVPFTTLRHMVVAREVVKGKRPTRPEGAERELFADDLWEILGLCWATEPTSRPDIKSVFDYLERASRSWKPPPRANTGVMEGGDESDLSVLLV